MSLSIHQSRTLTILCTVFTHSKQGTDLDCLCVQIHALLQYCMSLSVYQSRTLTTLCTVFTQSKQDTDLDLDHIHCWSIVCHCHSLKQNTDHCPYCVQSISAEHWPLSVHILCPVHQIQSRNTDHCLYCVQSVKAEHWPLSVLCSLHQSWALTTVSVSVLCLFR